MEKFKVKITVISGRITAVFKRNIKLLYIAIAGVGRRIPENLSFVIQNTDSPEVFRENRI